MTGVSGTVSSVGAGVSQGRFLRSVQPTQLKEQEQSEAGVRAAALQLIRSAITAPSVSSGHDLDVLA
jgi:hypothetical protein